MVRVENDGSSRYFARDTLSNRALGELRRPHIEATAAAQGKVTLRSLREARGLTPAEVGSQVGVIRNVVSNWENLRARPRPTFLLRLAELFGVEPEDIYIKEPGIMGRPRHDE